VDKPSAFEYGVDGPPLVSPDGAWRLRIRFNDAGGMHSGNHWTWILARDRLGLEYVVAQGYSLAEVRRREAALPIRWIDDRTFLIGFVDGRHSAHPKWQKVTRG
jgi:hypothetical protein